MPTQTDPLVLIRDTEQKGKRRIAHTEEATNEKIKKAREVMEQHVAEAEARAKQMIQVQMEETKLKAKELYRETLDHSAKARERLIAKAEAQKAHAVTLVWSAFEEQYGSQSSR